MSSLSPRPPISRQTLSSPSPIRSKIPAPRLRQGMPITRRFRRKHWSCTRLRSATSFWRPISDWKSVELANTTRSDQAADGSSGTSEHLSGLGFQRLKHSRYIRQCQQSDFHADREIEGGLHVTTEQTKAVRNASRHSPVRLDGRRWLVYRSVLADSSSRPVGPQPSSSLMSSN